MTMKIRTQRGVAIWEFALVLPVVLLVGLGVIDFGRFIYFCIEVQDAARAAALFGTQNSGEAVSNANGITKAAETAAPDILAPGSSQSLGTARWGTTPFVASGNTYYYGCECPNGSESANGKTNCGTGTGTNGACAGGQHEVYYVAVQTQATYKTLVPWSNFGSMGALWQALPSTYTMTGYAKVRLGPQ
jgi:Flp pilus assembly protein TadG